MHAVLVFWMPSVPIVIFPCRRSPDLKLQARMFSLMQKHLWLVVIFLYWMNVTVGVSQWLIASLHLHHSAFLVVMKNLPGHW